MSENEQKKPEIQEPVIEPIVNECKHDTGWGRLGSHPLNSSDGNVFIIGIVFCKKCGINKIQVHRIAPEKPAEEAKQEVAIPPVDIPSNTEAN